MDPQSNRHFPVVIYHNPQCGTSRSVLALVEAAGYQPTVIEYLKTGWTIGQLQGLFAEIARLSTPRQRARWLRLHYFSECFELASLWHGHGVDALLTTDKPALSHRMDAAAIAALQDRGHVDFGGMTMIRSHLRIETFAEEVLTE